MTPANDRPPDPPGGSTDDAELGAPVTELRDLMLAVDDRFSQKVRNRIDRRLLTGTFVDLAWTAPLMVLLELLRVPFELFSGRSRSS
jgi:hypothetical protein